MGGGSDVAWPNNAKHARQVPKTGAVLEETMERGPRTRTVFALGRSVPLATHVLSLVGQTRSNKG